MALEISYHLLDTSLGPLAIGWANGGLVRLQLPEIDRARSLRRLKAKRSAAWVKASPTPMVRQAIREMERHISGERSEFSDIPLDLTEISAFDRKLYEASPGRKMPGSIGFQPGSLGSKRVAGAKPLGRARAA